MSLLLAGTFVLTVCARQPGPVASTTISNVVVASPAYAAETSNGLPRPDLTSPFETEPFAKALSRSLVLKPLQVRGEKASGVPLVAMSWWPKCTCDGCCVY